jgi:hypothetical protein
MSMRQEQLCMEQSTKIKTIFESVAFQVGLFLSIFLNYLEVDSSE